MDNEKNLSSQAENVIDESQSQESRAEENNFVRQPGRTEEAQSSPEAEPTNERQTSSQEVEPANGREPGGQDVEPANGREPGGPEAEPTNERESGSPDVEPANERESGGPEAGRSENQSEGNGLTPAQAENQQNGGNEYNGQNTYGRQAYGGQFSGGPQNGQNTYGQQAYGGQNGYGQPYGNQNFGMGSQPLDGNGRPIPNRFGMKLTFSILEIICCNLISLVCGIIGCVYTTKANNAYNEGKWEEFKSHAKTSAICLWIGLGGFILEIIIAIFVIILSFGIVSEVSRHPEAYTYHSNEEYDDLFDDDTFPEETPAEPAPSEPEKPSPEIIPQGGFVDPEITINGISVTLPLAYEELKGLGFYVDAEDEDYIINIGEYYSTQIYLDEQDVGSAYVANMTDSPIALKDGMVFGFWLSEISEDYKDLEIAFANGITDDSTIADVMAAYGEPDYGYEPDEGENGYRSYQWYQHNDIYDDMDSNSLEIDFYDGEIYDLNIRYIGWD